MSMLIPCPGCGSTPQLKQSLPENYGEADTFQVVCKCGWGGPLKYSKDKAVKAWNHRVVEDSMLARIEETEVKHVECGNCKELSKKGVLQ